MTQITVGLPDHLVTFMDTLVSGGLVKSRAEVVAQALEREKRRMMGLADVEVLCRPATDADLDAPTQWEAARPVPLDD